MTLGNAIKLIRTARGLKQRDLAAKLGKSPNYLSLLEHDERQPSVPFLRQLAKELGVPVAMFFLWQDEQFTGLDSAHLAKFRDLMGQLHAMSIQGDSEDAS